MVKLKIFPLMLVIFPTVSLANQNQIRDIGVEDVKIVKQYGQSALLDTDGQKVLVLQGSNYQMGYAHGKLVGEETKKLLERVLLIAQAADSARKGDFFANTLEKIYERVQPYIPARYKEEIKGLADAIGMDYKKVMLANIFPELFHCSGYAFMKKATVDGKLIHVRVLDYMTQVGLQDHAIVIIQRPVGANTIMIPSFTGFIGCVTGMNDKQLAIGEMGMEGLGDWDGVPMAFMLRAILEECDTLSQMINYMKREARTCHYAYVFSDAKIPSAVLIHATYKKLETLGPGEYHPLLPNPVKDCVLASSGGRYDVLVERTKKYWGKIDVPTAIEITKRPVAMKSNLHDAIMVPEDGVMYLAVASDPDKEKYQACYQPYYKYELKIFLKIMDKLRDNRIKEPEHIPVGKLELKLRPKEKTQPKETVIGSVLKECIAPIPPDSNPEVAKLLSLYLTDNGGFKFKMEKVKSTEYYDVYNLTFPSPYKSPYPENNTVWCEYFKPKGNKKNFAVIVLHISENDFTLPRVICHLLASAGFDAVLMKMAYYGERRPKDYKTLLDQKGPEFLVKSVIQTVMDVRRTRAVIRFVNNYDVSQVGLCGVSLGALVSALTMGVDAQFPKAAIVLGGADLVSIIKAHSREVRHITQYIEEHNLTDNDLKQILKPVEPLTYIHRAAGTKVLVISAKGDEIIPKKSVDALVSHLNNPRVIWYNANHYTMIWHLVDAMQKVITFFYI